jgi:mannose-6-phosphate isomerase-like protein (cupin superfamily)
LISSGPGEGQRHEGRGSVMSFKATAQATGGRLPLMERTLPPGGRMPPAHVHIGCDGVFCVLAGQIAFVLDGHERVRGPDSSILVPGGTTHTFGNRSDTPARLLVLHPPAMDANLPSSSGSGKARCSRRSSRNARS